MVRGVAPLHTDGSNVEQSCIERARDWLFELTLAAPGDRVIMVSAANDAMGGADTLQVVTL